MPRPTTLPRTPIPPTPLPPPGRQTPAPTPLPIALLPVAGAEGVDGLAVGWDFCTAGCCWAGLVLGCASERLGARSFVVYPNYASSTPTTTIAWAQRSDQ